MKHFFAFWFLFLCTVVSYGQNVKLSIDNPQQFVTDVRTVLTGTKNESALKAATALETAWASGKLSDTQKSKVMGLTQQMLAKKLKPRPHLEAFWNLVSSSINTHQFTGTSLDQLLQVTEKTLQHQEPKVFDRFLQNSNQFLNNRTVYKGANNKLQVVGGTFAFEYRENTPAANTSSGWGDEPAEPVKENSAPVKSAAAKTAKPAAKPAVKKKVVDDPWAVPSKNAQATDDPWAAWGTPKKKVTKTTTKKSTNTSKATKAKAAKPVKEEKAPEKTEPEAPQRQAYLAEPLPVISGPVMVLQNVDLQFATPYDSATIKQTSGTVALGSNILVGQGGKFTWNRLGGEATAQLKGFALKTDNPGFKAEDVTLHFPAVLDNDIQGNLEYKLTRAKANAESAYPTFISHTNDAKINRFGADLKYVGGMALNGSTLMSAALDKSPSTIWVSSNDQQKFRTWARNFIINDSLVTAPVAAVTMFQGQDSITHPGLQFKYNKNARRLVLVDADGIYKKTPYYANYHQMELNSEMALWKIDQPEINFGVLTAKKQVPAQVNSKEYYAESRFQQIKTIANFHPLYTAVGYGLKRGTTSYNISELAAESKINEDALHMAMTILVQGRYLDYDPATGDVQLREKAYHYVDASRNKRDYDLIQINSLAGSGKNATLDLNTGDLILRGVKKFAFTSDSNSVYAEPDSQIVRIQKNRNILFNGKVISPNFKFKGEDFKFDYDGFFIDLAKIDSTLITTKSKDAKGKEQQHEFAMVNRNGKGSAKLYLNKPDNRSGRKKLPGFPALDAISGAVVYFNKPEILNGLYDTSFYFSVPPFKIDSMASNKRGVIGFKGTFYSGGVFPPFETKLSIMPDGALGFEHLVSKSGIDLYGGKGRFTDTLTMDTKGLRGKGSVSYQTATLYSKSFVFYKDSVITKVGSRGVFKEGSVSQGSYPSGGFKAYAMQWWPYKDTLEVNTKDRKLIDIYDGRYTYKGMLGFTPASLYGDGVVENKEVAIKSTSLVFTKGLIHAGRASMEIASANKKKPALSTYDISLDVHVDKGYAEYNPERQGSANTVFPFAQYKSSLGGGRWDFKKKKIALNAGAQDSSSAYFYAMKSGQDSIFFKAKGGEYDLSKHSLVASGVPYITIGDSYVIPDSNKVQILENGNMKAFRNAGLAMDSVQKFHNLVRGEVHIDNNVGISGNALYPFVAGADTAFVKFGNFTWNQPVLDKKAEKKGETAVPYFLASANVKETDTLYILPKVRFYGDIKMASNQKYMDFDGYAKLMVGDNKNAEWIPFKRTGLDPADVQLEVPKSNNVEDDIIASGIHISTATGKIYSTFISKKQDNSDLDLFETQGQLAYDKEKKQYRLGDQNRLSGKSYAGNLLQYDEANKQISYEGRFKLIEPAKGFSLQAAGNGTGRTDSSTYLLNTLMAFDIDIPSQAIESMAQKVAKAVEGAPEGVDLNNPALPYRLAEFIGDKGVEDFKAKTANGYVPLSQISPKLMHTLVLSDVQMKWSPKNNAWYSVGQLGLAGIDKSDINAKINGHIEIKRGAAGDAVTVYLEPTPYVWYFFNFFEGTLGIASSDGQFNGIVANKANNSFFSAEPEERVTFVNYFRKSYLGQGPMKATAQTPVYENYETAEEDTSGNSKKAKKKKAQAEENVDVPVPATATAATAEADVPVEEPAKKKKEKKKAVVETEPADVPDIPTADPEQQDTSKKKKKSKKEEKTPPPDIDPVGN